jgi:hypothetical protein
LTPDDGHPDGFSAAEVACLVLALDRDITRRRRARALHHLLEGRPLPLPVRPTGVELAVFTALAQTYGPAVLDPAGFALVLDRLAECGAVVVVQRALWGNLPEDYRLAARLLDARIPFEILCGTWPGIFMAQAQAELQGFRPRPPAPPMESDDGERDDG